MLDVTWSFTDGESESQESWTQNIANTRQPLSVKAKFFTGGGLKGNQILSTSIQFTNCLASVHSLFSAS
jgi:hypothetical protein